MAPPEWNKIDQFSRSFRVYNCAFLDILGYKQKSIDYFDGRFNLYGRINRALDISIDTQSLIFPLLNTSELTVEIISDSIIIMQPDNGNGLGAILLFACIFVSSLSYEGLFIRGGIARGRHDRRKTDQGFDFLASEALQKAYLLESEKAKYPRILIENDIIQNLPKEEMQFIVQENNDFILHFAYHVINRKGSNFNDVMAEMTELHSEMNHHNDDQIKAKYQWLLDYYFWTIAQNQNWNASCFASFASSENRGFAELKS